VGRRISNQTAEKKSTRWYQSHGYLLVPKTMLIRLVRTGDIHDGLRAFRNRSFFQILAGQELGNSALSAIGPRGLERTDLKPNAVAKETQTNRSAKLVRLAQPASSR
jgi:hypothetical protein